MPSGAKKRKAAKKSKQDEAQVITGRPSVMQAVAERNLEKHFGSQDDQDDESLTPKTPVRDSEYDDKGRVATQTGEWVKVLDLDVGIPTSQSARKIESEENYIPSGPTSLGDWETVSHDSNCDRQDFTDYQGSNRNAIYEDEHDNLKGCDGLHFGDAVELVSSQQEGNLEGSITSVSTEWDLPESIAAAEEAGADLEEANQQDIAEPENADATRLLAPGEEIVPKAEQPSESEAEKAVPTDDTSCPHEAFQESALTEGSLLMTQKAAPCTPEETKVVNSGEATQPIVQVVGDASGADQQRLPDVYDARAEEPIDEQDMSGNTACSEQGLGDSNGGDHTDEFAAEDAFPDKATEERAVDASGLDGSDELAEEDESPGKAAEEGAVDAPSKEKSVCNGQQQEASLKSEFLCLEEHTSEALERPNMTKELEDENEAPSEGLEWSSKIDLVVEEASEDNNISLNAKENLTHELNKVAALSEVTQKAEVTEDAKELTPAFICPASIKYTDSRLECAMPFGNQDMNAEQLLQEEVLSNLKDAGEQTRQSLPWPFENVDIKTLNREDDLPEAALGTEARKGQDIGNDYSDSEAHELCRESAIQLISECASVAREESLECSVMPAETDEVVQPVCIAEKDQGLQSGSRPDSGAVRKEDVYVNQRTVGQENNFTAWWRCCGILDLFLHRD